ncbi:MAG: hypothetical protein A2583_10100 [Bdellovibrionales bacterium RIFOXYD1_FULL_53_11]|nr:MAG: hypothetical protein A2583_10100 [Bdellovibrionales bacterium RIFOXYD1_FULL_53_11]
MKVAQSIRRQITDKGPDSLWSFDDFVKLPQQAVAKTLSRLSKEGLIQRMRKGVYYYPKITALGPSQPDASALFAAAIKKSKNITIYSGGTASFQNLGITTQAPAQYTILGELASRKIRIGRMTANIQRRSFAHLNGASQEDIWILDSIRNLKHVPDSTPSDAVAKIMSNFHASKRPLKKLLRFAQGEPPRVRAVIGAIAEQMGYHGPETRTLKKSLNPLTKFHIGITSVLSNASFWNIV